jgi:hypothetical protein
MPLVLGIGSFVDLVDFVDLVLCLLWRTYFVDCVLRMMSLLKGIFRLGMARWRERQRLALTRPSP